MQVHLEDWLLGDGQLDDPRVGKTLHGIAVLVRCESSGPSVGADSVVVQPERRERPESSSRLELDGTVVWRADDGRAAVLGVDHRLVALETEHRTYPAAWDPEVGDWDDVVRTLVRVPDPGDRVRVVGDASVMAEHELEEGYLLPTEWADAIQDTWDVAGITLVTHGRRGDGVVATASVRRASASMGLEVPVSFVLDLRPSATPYDRAKAAAGAPWDAVRVVEGLLRRSPGLLAHDVPSADPEVRLRAVVSGLVAELDGPSGRRHLRALDAVLRRADHGPGWVVTEVLGDRLLRPLPPSAWVETTRGWPRELRRRMTLVVDMIGHLDDHDDDGAPRTVGGFAAFQAGVDAVASSHAGRPWRDVRAALDDQLYAVIRRPVSWNAPAWAEATARDIEDPRWRRRNPWRAWRLRNASIGFTG